MIRRATAFSGIPAVGELEWGTHFCQFYQGPEDLVETLIPYFRAGLENNEFCVLVGSEPLQKPEILAALEQAIPEFDEYYRGRRQLEVYDYREWYYRGGQFDRHAVLSTWIDKEKKALDQGFTGLRVTGNTLWLCDHEWDDFRDYEAEVNGSLGEHRVIALCTYCLDRCSANDVLDVVRTHQFALARKDGAWEMLESAALRGAKEELRQLNAQLEQRVADRTRELEQALRARDQFLAMLSHELRNPLAAITSCVKLLKLPSLGTEELEWSKEVLERQSGQMARMLDDLLDVSRVATGKVHLRGEQADISAVVQQALDAIRPQLEARTHQVKVDLGAGPLIVHGDRARLEQVVVNLLSNAIKYTEPGGRIRVSVERGGEEAVIRVADSGAGICPELLPRIFEPFTQAEQTLDRSRGGLGIGLTLVKQLTELHGGRVAAHSAGIGRGAEFMVWLPLSAAALPANSSLEA